MSDTWRIFSPDYLFLLLLPVVILWWHRPRGGVTFGAFPLALQALQPSRRPLLHRLLVVMGLTCLVLALARPGFGRQESDDVYEGRDLVLVIDLSLSMIADDMLDEEGRRIDRLAAVNAAAKRFIDNRPNDRIGIVFFGNTSLLACPPTTDHGTVQEELSKVERQQRALWDRYQHFYEKSGLLGAGTNLGLGIGAALRGLAETDSRGKAIILITDGKDSRRLDNWVDPIEAAGRSRALDTRIHCIGVGNERGTMMDPTERYGSDTRMPLRPEFLPDMGRLRAIATTAGGIAMHANDREELEGIFARIDELEPTPKTEHKVDFYTDRFHLLLLCALGLLLSATLFDPLLLGRP